ncbi:MAG: META domain-containing protein [Allosphingosinicella sp.]
MKQLLPLVALFAAGCATVPPPPSSSAAYRALGTEPFWAVTIANGQMAFDAPDGPRFSVPAPPPRTTFNGHRYETSRLTMGVTHGVCSDGMSDRRYADTVMVIVDGRTLNGCGGAILAPETLADTSWAISEIDGLTVEGDEYFVQFDADRMSGKAGCNRFSGSYSVSGETMILGPVAATRMACPGPRMEHERRALQVLSGAVRVMHPDGDTLVLTGNGGTLRLRRSI